MRIEFQPHFRLGLFLLFFGLYCVTVLWIVLVSVVVGVVLSVMLTDLVLLIDLVPLSVVDVAVVEFLVVFCVLFVCV